MSQYDEGPRAYSLDDEADPVAGLARTAWQLLLFVGIASVILGLIALFWTRGTLIVAGVLFGIYLILSGVAQLAAAFDKSRPGNLRFLNGVVGVISIVLGVFCFFGPLESVALLSIWIGVGFLLRGIALATIAGTLPSAPGRGFQIFVGVLLAIAGIVMLVWPTGSIATLTILAGWWLLIVGVVEIVHAFQLRSATKRM
jgi:uncharacterized membrane protein HdeD (DUF308 family)